MILAAKVEPKEKLIAEVCKSGIKAVELYFTKDLLRYPSKIISLCKKFSLRYAVHASNDGCALSELAEVAKGINAEIAVFHNIFWEDEWEGIVNSFRNVPTRLCVENTYSVHEPIKFMRRFDLSRCLDVEHLQMECCGVYEDIFISLINEASHIHLTGYKYASRLWHPHIHHSPAHSKYILGLLEKANYSGFVVSEAMASMHTYEDFRKLCIFFDKWKKVRNELGINKKNNKKKRELK